MALPPLAFRSVFISDIHLGSSACKIADFNEFLHTFTCEKLYLVGDVIDVWVVVKSGKWKQVHTNAVRSLLGKSKHGCAIYYTPGNHDTFLRRLNTLEIGNIAISDTFVHETADGKRLLVIHGDQYDSSVRSFALAFTGTWLYEIITVFKLARQRRKGGGDAKGEGLKKKFKKLVSAMGNFEAKLMLAAQSQECDGVVCGHIHRPNLYEKEGIIYANCGDWVENRTALVEWQDGRLELATWDQIKAWAASAEYPLALSAETGSEVR
jgi:UDP-2,3-diacylglucosamine pyrophosphatase LpxH